MTHVIIIEDEASAVRDIAGYVAGQFAGGSYELHTFCHLTDFEARLPQLSSIDIALVDIDLATEERDGIDLAVLLNQRFPHCQVIFVTAHINYISAVYEVSHVYYVLKKDMAFWLPKALEKAIAQIGEAKDLQVSFLSQRKLTTIYSKSILYCERHKRITQIVTEHGRYESAISLEELRRQLPPRHFARCHKSFLLNLRHVEQYQKTEFLLRTGTIIPISRTFAEEARQSFLSYVRYSFT